MTATVSPSIHGGWYAAWCSQCITGYGGEETFARNWAYLHNENHHQGKGNE